jgi:hypothetical protein
MRTVKATAERAVTDAGRLEAEELEARGDLEAVGFKVLSAEPVARGSRRHPDMMIAVEVEFEGFGPASHLNRVATSELESCGFIAIELQ